MSRSEALSAYSETIAQVLGQPTASEQIPFQALTAVLATCEGVRAVHDPASVELGAPDFILYRGPIPSGFIVTVALGSDLTQAESQGQPAEYRATLPNLILTNYVEWRWYVFGELHATARLGEIRDGKLKRARDGIDQINRLLNGFAEQVTPAIRSAADLANQMGHIGRKLRDLIGRCLTAEAPSHALRNQMQTCQETLALELSSDQFADMLAQTIVYSLFAARMRHQGTGRDALFQRKDAFWDLPPTNPFLRELFNEIAGANLDWRVEWLVDTLVDVLAHMDRAEISRDFGRRKRQDDPLTHFYEVFLNKYDPRLRERRGIFYTPEPVVSYMVRSVDYLLRKRFKRGLGLASPETLILDPAVGTGTFLYFVIQQIYDTLHQQRQMGAWDDYVRDHLLPRVLGYELLMAPYAITHLKISYELQEMGYQFANNQRLGVFLTNTLDKPALSPGNESGFVRLLAEEVQAAEVERKQPIMVVLGNPPYAYQSTNTGEWITALIQDYYTVDGEPLDERNSKGLQDDYVKFIRYGEHSIEETGSGILAFITNNGYLDNPTFRGMRQHLLDTFGDLYLLNLHGDGRKAETAPDGTADQNVFDIQTGVTIGLFIRQPDKSGRGRIHYADVWGRREDKYDYLLKHDVSTITWHDVYPQKPFYLFVPHDDTVNLADEYQQWFKITDIFKVKSTGITTHHDRFALAFDRETLEQRISRFRSSIVSDESLREDFGLPDTKDWELTESRQQLREMDNWQAYFTDYLYRPFDLRTLYYQPALVNRPRTKVMRHLLYGNNLALCTTRQVIDEFSHVLCTLLPVDNSALSTATRERTKVFPLYLYPVSDKAADSPFAPGVGGRQPNLNPAFVQAAARKLEMTFIPDGRGDCKHTFGPNDVFAYSYAILHSPTYRRRYAAFFKYDYPHIPLTHDKKLFRALTRKGRNLVNLHLMRKSGLWTLMTGFMGTGGNQVEESYPRYTELIGEEGGRVYINATKYFAGMPPAAWDFRIGGQRVLEKWLQNRRGYTLTFADTLYYQRIIVALAETLRMMDDIDDLIPVWPLL